jgi:hypothetical protein
MEIHNTTFNSIFVIMDDFFIFEDHVMNLEYPLQINLMNDSTFGTIIEN